MENGKTEFLSVGDTLLISILEYFRKNEKGAKFMLDVMLHKNGVSLRILDWFPTNYSKEFDVHVDGVNVHKDYRNALKGFQKNYFDPFARKKKIMVKKDLSSTAELDTPVENSSEWFTTTVGQLNFFRWCSERNLVEYILENKSEIDRHMKEHLKEIAQKGRKRQHSKPIIKKTSMKVVLKF